MKKDINNLLDFLHQAEKLKTVLRHSWLSSGRRESVAEHTWRIGIMAMVLAPYLKKKVNLEKVFKMLLIHDLPEVYAGDYFAWKAPLKNKYQNEKNGLNKILKVLPQKSRKEMAGIWQEHEAWKTEESKFVRALDKLEALIQHSEGNIKHLNKTEIRLNLTYGLKHCEFDPFLKLFRQNLNRDFIKIYKKHKINKKLYA